MFRLMIIVAALTLTGATAGAHKVVRKTAALDFSYVWPAKAVAIPELDHRFYTEAKAALAEAQANVADDQAAARKDKRDFNPHDYSMEWTTAGETERLLSLENELSSFEGGAHPNTTYDALLWDRTAHGQISFASLFLQSGTFAALTRVRYCNALNVERRKRRNGEKFAGDFDECPKYNDLAIAPVDSDSDSRFDTIHFVASPYVAGPYVEGQYSVSLPVTSQLIAGIKPEYRNSFERQRQ